MDIAEEIKVSGKTLPLKNVLNAIRALKNFKNLDPENFTKFCLFIDNDSGGEFESFGKNFLSECPHLVNINNSITEVARAVVCFCSADSNGTAALDDITAHRQLAPYFTTPFYNDGGPDNNKKTAATIERLSQYYLKLEAIKLRMKEIMKTAGIEFDEDTANIERPDLFFSTIPFNGGIGLKIYGWQPSCFVTPLGQYHIGYASPKGNFYSKQTVQRRKQQFKDSWDKISETFALDIVYWELPKGGLANIGKDVNGKALPTAKMAHLTFDSWMLNHDISGLKGEKAEQLWRDIQKKMQTTR